MPIGALVLLVVIHVLWPAPAGVILQGVLIGGLTALVSLGIALVYRANRIVNFAQGDLGGLSATLGVLFIVSSGLNYFLALSLTLVASVALGSFVEFAIIRRFFRAPRLILTVATIGLAQILAAGGLLLPQVFSVTVPPQNYPPPFHAAFTFFGTTFRGNDIIAMIVIPLMFVALALFLRRTSLGAAIRASADDPDRATMLGISVKRLHSVVWVIASMLSSVGLFLRAGVVGLPIGTVLGPGVLLRALAACVIGRMDNLAVIAGAAIGLGVIEQSIVQTSGRPLNVLGMDIHGGALGLVDPVLFMVILLALLVDRRRRSARALTDPAGGLATREVRPIPQALRSLPAVRRARLALLAGAAVVAVALPAVLSESRINLVAATMIFAIIGLSLIVLTGWGGQISLGHMAFAGIGAAVGGWVTATQGWDISLAILAGGLVGAVVALIIGLPALRLGGLELAVTTLAFALAVSSYVLNPKYIHWLPTGRLTRRPVLGFISVATETRFYYLTLVCLVLALLALSGLRRSRTGRALIATRENGGAAQSYGINTTRTTLAGFAMSGFLAAAAGSLLVHHQQSLGISPYAVAESLALFTMVVVGGLSSAPGVLLGAAYLRGIDYFLPSQYRILASGAGLIAILLLAPNGLVSLAWRARDAWLESLARRHGLTDSDEVAPKGSEPEPGVHESLPPDTSATLSVRGLHAGYGGAPILFGVDLDVRAAEIVAIVGTNGAGKSTLLRAISGLVSVTAGTITLHGADMRGVAAHKMASNGISHLPGGHGVFTSLTVAENLSLASRHAGRAGPTSAMTPTPGMTDPTEHFPVLRERINDRAGDLSGGQQQMLALAMVLISPPKLLLLDELSLGLAPAIVAQLLPLVAALRDAGTAIVIVEQSVSLALEVADTAYVMEKGLVRFRGPASELAGHPELLRSIFLAGAAGAVETTGPPAPGSSGHARETAVLTVDGASCHFGGVKALQDVSLRLGDGEILGLIGANGAGKTTLFDVISGCVGDATGSIHLAGSDVSALAPYERARVGLGRSYQDSRLFPALTVAETIAIALEPHIAVRDPVAAALHLPAVHASEAWVGERVDQLLELFGLAALRERFVDELSTGTRRVVDLACLVGQGPRVVMFDEPSAGIAQREAEELVPLLRRLRDQAGASLLIIEHNLPLVAGLADRLVALDLGRVIAEGSPDEVLNHPDVVASYLGEQAPAS